MCRRIHAIVRERRKSIGAVAGLALLLSGCLPAPIERAEPTPDEIELQNARTSLEMVRDALGQLADERDRFQELYLTASSELSQRRGDVEQAEAQSRVALSRDQEAQRRVRELEGSLDRSNKAQEDVAAVVSELQAGAERLRERLRAADRERDDLTRSLADLRAEREQLVAQNSTLQHSLAEIRGRLESTEGSLQKGQLSAHQQLEAKSRQVAQLEQEVQLLRPLRDEVERLRSALGATEQAKNSAVRQRLQLERSKGQVADAEDSASPLEAASGLWGALCASVDRLRTGNWSSQDLVLPGALLLGFCVTVFLFVSWRRGKAWKRRARELSRPTVSKGSAARAAAVAGGRPAGPVQKITVPSSFAPPAEPFSGTAVDPPAAVSAAEEVTQVLSPASGAAVESPADPTSTSPSWDSAVTEDLDDLLRESGVVRGDSRGRKASEDERLLEDLRQVIHENLDEQSHEDS